VRPTLKQVGKSPAPVDGWVVSFYAKYGESCFSKAV